MAASRKSPRTEPNEESKNRSPPGTMSGAKPAKKITLGLQCWSCKTASDLDLVELQKDRLEIKYDLVKPNSRKPRKYFIKCPSCSRFNSVKL